MVIIKSVSGFPPRNKRFPPGLKARSVRTSSSEMSSAEPSPSAAILRAPAQPLWLAVAKRLGLGLGFGLLVALVFVVLDHRKANSVVDVCVEARSVLMYYRAEKDAWPKDFDLAAPGEPFAGFKLGALAAAVARCEVPGRWTFEAKSAAGFPAVVFTPAEPGRSYARVFAVADGWLDDGRADAGELRVGETAAYFRLSAE